MFCFTTIFSHHDKLKATLHEKCPLRASPIFRDITSDIMSLAQIDHPWNITEEITEFTGIPLHILLISDIEGLKREIESLKGEITNQLQDEMDKRGFSSMEHNTKRIIDEMASQTTNIMEETVIKTDLITSKVTEGSGTNGSNLMDTSIEEEEEE